MRNRAVIGLGFGDEGKGRVVDYLCSKGGVSLVVRYCGGHQAAHHVIARGVDHVFSNFGSGTIQGVPTYWSKYCTFDPQGASNEYEDLVEKNLEPVLFVDERCPVTTSLDILANIKNNQLISNGTCGVGFGNTIQRTEDHHRLLFGDLGFPSIVRIKYDLIRKYYKEKHGISDDKFIFDPVESLLSGAELECIKPTLGIPVDFMHEPHLYEGSQGLLLDQDIGFFPHVTRSYTGTRNILDIDMMGLSYLFLVTRAYQTRHGRGPMTNENIPHNISVNPYDKQDESGPQGEFRISLLDLDLLNYAIQSDSYIRNSHSKTLVITCMDLVSDELRLTHKGNIFVASSEQDFLTKIKEILGITDILVSRGPFGELDPK